ncbi:hypothetical protein EGW08_007591, partial [Elysia chlorotica]
ICESICPCRSSSHLCGPDSRSVVLSSVIQSFRLITWIYIYCLQWLDFAIVCFCVLFCSVKNNRDLPEYEINLSLTSFKTINQEKFCNTFETSVLKKITPMD